MHDPEKEQQVVELHPLRQFAYVRESVKPLPSTGPRFQHEGRHKLGPIGSVTVAYAIAGDSVRFWWLWLPSILDGVECPVEYATPEFKFVVPSSIAPQKQSKPWPGIANAGLRHPPLKRRPQHLWTRWETWQLRHAPRVIKLPGRWRKLWHHIRAKFKR
jgi:hypothetical protein